MTDRFWSKVRMTHTCWIWTGHRNESGYGYTFAREGSRRVHRRVYELLVGPVPEGMELDHLCRNRACVNPEHLEPVTHAENVLRGNGWAARNARKTHCANGHEFTPENTYRYARGRVCKACNLERTRRWRQAR